VTGGAGFIGSHLVEKLVNLGAKVTVFDDFSSGSLNNLKSVITRINVNCASITSKHLCLKATKKQDYIFHLAAFISSTMSVKEPDLCNKINIEGTANILEGAVLNEVKTVVYSSSSAIYGDKKDVCCEDDLTDPKTPYATSKLEGEKLCKEVSLNHDVSTSCLRYFNVYGDRQRGDSSYSSVVAQFKKNLVNKKPITIYGNGNQIRDFIHVSQVVEANLKIALLKNEGTVFNIASGKSINLFELITKLEQELKVKSTDINFEDAREGDIAISKANCSKYKNAISQM